MVDALQGAPGIFSARYAGPAATDEQNNARLLDELGDTPPEHRSAHYVCELASVRPSGSHSGTLRGHLQRENSIRAGGLRGIRLRSAVRNRRISPDFRPVGRIGQGGPQPPGPGGRKADSPARRADRRRRLATVKLGSLRIANENAPCRRPLVLDSPCKRENLMLRQLETIAASILAICLLTGATRRHRPIGPQNT